MLDDLVLANFVQLLLVPIDCLLIYLIFYINNHILWEYDRVFISLLILIILFTIFYICQDLQFYTRNYFYVWNLNRNIFKYIVVLSFIFSIWFLNMQLSFLFMIAFIVVTKFLFDHSCHLRKETLRSLFSLKIINIYLLVWTHWCYSSLSFLIHVSL